MKLKPLSSNTRDIISCYLFYCPGCKTGHPYEVPRWSFNGDLERPSFSPSLLCYPAPPMHGRCHLFVTDGKIIYCGDCDHALAGQTIDLPDIPSDDALWGITENNK